jgi:hypothetical protein
MNEQASSKKRFRVVNSGILGLTIVDTEGEFSSLTPVADDFAKMNRLCDLLNRPVTEPATLPTDLRSYFVVRSTVVEGYPEACYLDFKVGVQQFHIGPEYCEDRAQAEWFIDMLCKAFTVVIDAVQPTPPPPSSQDDTIKSLCDRIERIDQIAHDTAVAAEDRVRQIQEWSAGFMPVPGQPPFPWTFSVRITSDAAILIACRNTGEQGAFTVPRSSMRAEVLAMLRDDLRSVSTKIPGQP